MAPRRLPRPGQVIETCRLCHQPVDVSVENPRRVCAHCGEINLPTDGAPETGAAPSARRAPPLRRPSLEVLRLDFPPLVLGLNALPGVVAAAWGIWSTTWHRRGGGLHLPSFDAAFNAALVLGPAVLVGLAVTLFVLLFRGEVELKKLAVIPLGTTLGIGLGAVMILVRSAAPD